jgi:hypothetical protein
MIAAPFQKDLPSPSGAAWNSPDKPCVTSHAAPLGLGRVSEESVDL